MSKTTARIVIGLFSSLLFSSLLFSSLLFSSLRFALLLLLILIVVGGEQIEWAWKHPVSFVVLWLLAGSLIFYYSRKRR